MACAPTAIRNLIPELIKVLPDKAPGISAAEAHKALGDHVAGSSVRTALAVLERDGIATSYREKPTRNMPWLFHRVSEAEEADNFEDAKLVYEDRE